jgi:Flp pilus assembly protein TadD
LGLEHQETLETVSKLGVLYKKQGRLMDAETMYRRALDGYEKVLGTEHKLTLNMINNIRVVCGEQDKLVDAEALLLRALGSVSHPKFSNTEVGLFF